MALAPAQQARSASNSGANEDLLAADWIQIGNSQMNFDVFFKPADGRKLRSIEGQQVMSFETEPAFRLLIDLVLKRKTS